MTTRYELRAYLAANMSTITNALYLHADRMTRSADEAQQLYEQGQADPAIRARQDATFMTNPGYRHSAQVLREDGERAKAVAERLQELIDDDEDEGYTE